VRMHNNEFVSKLIGLMMIDWIIWMAVGPFINEDRRSKQ